MEGDGELRARGAAAGESDPMLERDTSGAPDKIPIKPKTVAQRIRERNARSRGSGGFQCTAVCATLLVSAAILAVLLFYIESQAQIPGLCKESGDASKAKAELERTQKLLGVIRGCCWCLIAVCLSGGIASAFGLRTPPVILSDFGAPAPWPESPDSSSPPGRRLKGVEADRWAMQAAAAQSESAMRDPWRPFLQVMQAAALLGAGVWAAVVGVPSLGLYAGNALLGDISISQECNTVPYLTGVALSDGCLMLALLYTGLLSYFALRSVCRSTCPGLASQVYKTELEDLAEIERMQAATAAEDREEAEAARVEAAAEAGRSGGGVRASYGAYQPAFPSRTGTGILTGLDGDESESSTTQSNEGGRHEQPDSSSMDAVAAVAAGTLEHAAAADSSRAPTQMHSVPGSATQR